MEQIYTIPVNEAFDAAIEKPELGCPLCALYAKLEENELDRILGGAMMEPDVRIETNREGFCHRHFSAMFGRKNRLGLALILESHLDETEAALFDPSLLDRLTGKVAAAEKKAGERVASCYLCRRIERNFAAMVSTVVLLYETDPAFPEKMKDQPYFCLPHYHTLLKCGLSNLPKKKVAPFFGDLAAPTRAYLKTLREDVSWFCKKFDYRYEDEPWYNAKDSVERAIRFLSAEEDLS